MLDCHFILVPVLLALSFPGPTQQRQLHSQTAITTIDAPLQELMDGYLQWIHNHPDAMQTSSHPVSPQGANKRFKSNEAADLLKIRMPSIDLYEPSGASIYHGTDSGKNAEFLRGVPENIPSIKGVHVTEIRPTLQEATAMFAELKPYLAHAPDEKEFTIFALTYPNTPLCKAQNEAIEQLKSRQARHVRIIEIRLHK